MSTETNFRLGDLPAPKLESLREAFEATLHVALLKDIPEDARAQVLLKTESGNYFDPAIDGAWHGFQWGGDHVRGLVQNALRKLEGRHLGEVRRVGDAPADPARPNAEAVAASHYPSREDEMIDWSLPLFDSDGYQHRLVELGGVQVVTRYSFAFVVWDRKTLQMVGDPWNPPTSPLSITNTPMSEEERERRRQVGFQMLSELQEQAARDETPATPRG